jgi:hypothetical protein
MPIARYAGCDWLQRYLSVRVEFSGKIAEPADEAIQMPSLSAAPLTMVLNTVIVERTRDFNRTMNNPRNTRKGLAVARIRANTMKRFDFEHSMRPADRHLDELFEKIYHHEIDGRDKVAQRLQLPLVAFLAISGFVGTLLQSVQRTDYSNSAIAFWISLTLAIAALVGASGYFVVSLIGKKYSYLQSPADWHTHHLECLKLYSGYEFEEKLVGAALKKNLIATYVKCATANGDINARKSYYVFMLLRCLVAGAIFTVVAFGIFFFAKLDRNISRAQRVEITAPIIIKGEIMTNQKPPAAPPPPPSREIREDRPTPTTPKQPQPPPGARNG